MSVRRKEAMMAESSNTAASVERAEHNGESCWSCGDMRAVQFCHACGKVQPPRPVDYFSFFGLPHKLGLNLEHLEKDFYEMSRKLHPDLYVHSQGREQQWSLEQSSRLNDAYRTLKDPIKRTEYLLRLEGVELEEQSKTATEAARASGEQKKQVVPPELLEEVFELNMQLEEARMNKKMGEHDAALGQELAVQKNKLEHQLEEFSRELQQDWQEWDALIEREVEGKAVPPEARQHARDKMVDVLNRRNYVRNLVRTVEEVIGG